MTLFIFLKNIAQYKYVLYIGFKFEEYFRNNEDFNLTIIYIDTAHLVSSYSLDPYRFVLFYVITLVEQGIFRCFQIII